MEGGGKEGKKGGREEERSQGCVCGCVCVCLRCVCVCVCAQSCLTLCDPKDCRWPDSSVRGIFQARILEWVAISYSRGSSQPRDRTHISCVSCTGRWVLQDWTTWDTHSQAQACNHIIHASCEGSVNTRTDNILAVLNRSINACIFGLKSSFKIRLCFLISKKLLVG